MKTKRAAVIGLAVSILTIIALGYLLSPQISFNTRNPEWNGQSKLESTTEPAEVESLSNLQPRISRPTNAVLLILGPSKEFSEVEAEKVQQFVESGGRLVLADDFGSGNDLLEKMEIDMRFSGNLLKDPVFKIKDSKIPKIFGFEKSPLVENVSSLALNSATVLEEAGPACEILARSPKSSYIGENEHGPFPVICRMERGKGEITLISDSSLFINAMLKRENNRKLLGNLIGGREVYLDTSHWRKSSFVQFQDALFEIYDLMDRVEIRYGSLLLLIAFIFKIGWDKRDREVEDKEEKVEEIMKRHPQWDEETLKRLREERNP